MNLGRTTEPELALVNLVELLQAHQELKHPFTLPELPTALRPAGLEFKDLADQLLAHVDPALRGLVATKLARSMDCEDVVQDAREKFLRKLHSADEWFERASLGAVAATCARDTRADEIRDSNGRRPTPPPCASGEDSTAWLEGRLPPATDERPSDQIDFLQSAREAGASRRDARIWAAYVADRGSPEELARDFRIERNNFDQIISRVRDSYNRRAAGSLNLSGVELTVFKNMARLRGRSDPDQLADKLGTSVAEIRRTERRVKAKLVDYLRGGEAER